MTADRDTQVQALMDEQDRILRSWNEPRGPVNYQAIVNTFAISAKLRDGATRGRDFACAHLGVTTPPLLFYKRSIGTALPDAWTFKGRDRNGHADRSTRSIGVRIEQETTPWRAAEVAAHEVFHLTQPAVFGEAAIKRQEEEAIAYGVWAAGVLFDCDGRMVKAVHTFRGHPYHFITLPGVTDAGDVLIATDDGTRGVWWNRGGKEQPEWARHPSVCPVEIPGRLAA